MEQNTRASLELLHGTLTSQIIGAFFDVYNELGHGYAELVYQRAVVIALGERRVQVETERTLTIYYYGQVVGEYRGSSIIERFIDPNDPNLKNYNETNDKVDAYYRYRIVATKQFSPH